MGYSGNRTSKRADYKANRYNPDPLMHTAFAYDLAWKHARRMNAFHMLEDYEQAAMIGLMVAAKKYDPSRGFAFVTPAKLWIVAELQKVDKHRENGHTLRNEEVRGSRVRTTPAAALSLDWHREGRTDHPQRWEAMVDEEYGAVELRMALRSVLTDPQWEAVVLLERGFSQAEGAEILGISKQAFAYRVQRARERILEEGLTLR